MNTVTLAITLPIEGTAFDYQQAIVAAMHANYEALAQRALSGLLAQMHTPLPAHFNVSGARSVLVFGKS